MFDIGFSELILVAVVTLLVIGPEKLPETLRTLGLWLGRLRRSFTSVKSEIEREIGMDDVRRQLHNEAIMDEMKRIEREVKNTMHAPAVPSPVPSSAPSSAPSPAPPADKPAEVGNTTTAAVAPARNEPSSHV